MQCLLSSDDVASHSYITRPISIFVDELVKPSINMPTVLCDSGELIHCLEKIELPTNCLLVTADVSSLYLTLTQRRQLLPLTSCFERAR